MALYVEPTYTIRLYMAGDIEGAKQLLRKECYPPNEGICVTIEPTTYIYAGGEESGFVVGFVNYPRFPIEPDRLLHRAKHIAEMLIANLYQWSALLVTPSETLWITNRPENTKETK